MRKIFIRKGTLWILFFSILIFSMGCKESYDETKTYDETYDVHELNGKLTYTAKVGEKYFLVHDEKEYGKEFGHAGYPLVIKPAIVNDIFTYTMTYNEEWPTMWPDDLYIVHGENIYVVWQNGYSPCYYQCKNRYGDEPCDYLTISEQEGKLAFNGVRNETCVTIVVHDGKEIIT